MYLVVFLLSLGIVIIPNSDKYLNRIMDACLIYMECNLEY